MSRIKNVLLVQPMSTGGNFEYVAIPRQGLLFISGALRQWEGKYLYDRQIWFEDRSGYLDPERDLDGVDIVLVTALINEVPRIYELTRRIKELWPELPVVGGGPHLGQLPEEAFQWGGFDVIVQREGEDVIGRLCDVLVGSYGEARQAALSLIPGITYLEKGQVVRNKRHGAPSPDFVELPDWRAIKDLTPRHPMSAGVIETVRGCTESCTYCEVIQQFIGYRMVRRETEIKRLQQIRQLAEDGLIYVNPAGRIAVFVSDDLHPPPSRAVKFRHERMARIYNWKGHTEGMFLVCQARAELGQDAEMCQGLRDIGMAMLYVGVESSNAKNLELVKKRQEPEQVHKDLMALNNYGFTVVAMTIIGLPYDTEESIMEMADWVKGVSRYQTANLLTPLPATINWALAPLDGDGSLLPEGKLRPYHLYTGRQIVYQDERWGLRESAALFDRYHARLRPVDRLYERIFRWIQERGAPYDWFFEHKRQERERRNMSVYGQPEVLTTASLQEEVEYPVFQPA